MQKSPWSSRWSTGLALCWLFVASIAVAKGAAPQPVLSFPISTDFTVLELVSTSPAIVDPKEAPVLRIHGDGRVHAKRPSFLRNPGDFEAYLSSGDLQALLSYCASKGLMEFDRRAVSEEHRAAARKRLQRTGSVPGVTDAETTSLLIRLSEYASAGSEAVIKDFEKTIYWYALSDVVAWYPEVEALSNFKDVVDVLQSIQDATIAANKSGELTIRLPPTLEEMRR